MVTKNSRLQKGIICKDRNVSKMSYLQDKLTPKKIYTGIHSRYHKNQ